MAMTTEAKTGGFKGFLKTAALFIGAWLAMKLILALWGVYNTTMILEEFTPEQRAAYAKCGDDLGCFLENGGAMPRPSPAEIEDASSGDCEMLREPAFRAQQARQDGLFSRDEFIARIVAKDLPDLQTEIEVGVAVKAWEAPRMETPLAQARFVESYTSAVLEVCRREGPLEDILKIALR